jgi:hypothetical protein
MTVKQALPPSFLDKGGPDSSKKRLLAAWFGKEERKEIPGAQGSSYCLNSD